MKTVGFEETTLEDCLNEAQSQRVIVTRAGKPVAMIVGVEGMDSEQLELSGSARFWELIEERRAQRTLNRAELERKLNGMDVE
ncbi:MAG: hypothetical protein ACREIV_07665 [Planctomycetaceae bacterium]